MRKAAPSVPQRQIVAFRLGDSEFGLDVFAAHEVLRVPSITAVPGSPSFVEGVIDVRGTLIPVVDLRRRFDVDGPAFDAETRIVLVSVIGDRIGLIVDRVTEVLRVPETAVMPPPGYVQHRAASSLTAIVRVPDRLILLLDVERLLSSDERIALRELEAAIAEMRAEEAATVAGNPMSPDASDRNPSEESGS